MDDLFVLMFGLTALVLRAVVLPRLVLGRGPCRKKLVRHRSPSLRGPSRRQMVLAGNRRRRGHNPFLPVSYLEARELIRHQPKLVARVVESLSFEGEVSSASLQSERVAEKFLASLPVWQERRGRGHRRTRPSSERVALLAALAAKKPVAKKTPAKKPVAKKALRVVRTQGQNEFLWHQRQRNMARARVRRAEEALRAAQAKEVA